MGTSKTGTSLSQRSIIAAPSIQFSVLLRAHVRGGLSSYCELRRRWRRREQREPPDSCTRVSATSNISPGSIRREVGVDPNSGKGHGKGTEPGFRHLHVRQRRDSRNISPDFAGCDFWPRPEGPCEPRK